MAWGLQWGARRQFLKLGGKVAGDEKVGGGGGNAAGEAGGCRIAGGLAGAGGLADASPYARPEGIYPEIWL